MACVTRNDGGLSTLHAAWNLMQPIVQHVEVAYRHAMCIRAQRQNSRYGLVHDRVKSAGATHPPGCAHLLLYDDLPVVGPGAIAVAYPRATKRPAGAARLGARAGSWVVLHVLVLAAAAQHPGALGHDEEKARAAAPCALAPCSSGKQAARAARAWHACRHMACMSIDVHAGTWHMSMDNREMHFATCCRGAGPGHHPHREVAAPAQMVDRFRLLQHPFRKHRASQLHGSLHERGVGPGLRNGNPYTRLLGCCARCR